MSADSARDRRDRDPVAEVIEFKPYKDGYAVRFDYDPFLVALLKKLPQEDRRYVKDWKGWIVATPRARFLATVARVLGYTVRGIEDSA